MGDIIDKSNSKFSFNKSDIGKIYLHNLIKGNDQYYWRFRYIQSSIIIKLHIFNKMHPQL